VKVPRDLFRICLNSIKRRLDPPLPPPPVALAALKIEICPCQTSYSQQPDPPGLRTCSPPPSYVFARSLLFFYPRQSPPFSPPNRGHPPKPFFFSRPPPIFLRFKNDPFRPFFPVPRASSPPLFFISCQNVLIIFCELLLMLFAPSRAANFVLQRGWQLVLPFQALNAILRPVPSSFQGENTEWYHPFQVFRSSFAIFLSFDRVPLV